MADSNSRASKIFIEHRRADRIAANLMVEYKLEGVRRLNVIGLCEDISGSGMRISTDQPILPG